MVRIPSSWVPSLLFLAQLFPRMKESAPLSCVPGQSNVKQNSPLVATPICHLRPRHDFKSQNCARHHPFFPVIRCFPLWGDQRRCSCPNELRYPPRFTHCSDCLAMIGTTAIQSPAPEFAVPPVAKEPSQPAFSVKWLPIIPWTLFPRRLRSFAAHFTNHILLNPSLFLLSFHRSTSLLFQLMSRPVPSFFSFPKLPSAFFRCPPVVPPSSC